MDEKKKSRVETDMWDQEAGSEGTVSNAVRRFTSQWGLPEMACGHNGESLIRKPDGSFVCSLCGK